MKPVIRLLRYVFPHKWQFLFALLSMALVAQTVVAFTSLVMPIFDQVLVPPKAITTAPPVVKENALSLLNRALSAIGIKGIDQRTIFIEVPIIIIFLFAVKGLFSYFSQYFMGYVGQSVVKELRNELYTHFQYQSLRFFDRFPTGVLISRVISDVERIQSVVAEKLGDLIREGLTLIGLVLYLFYLSWRLTVISLIAVPLIAYPIFKLGERLRRMSAKSQEQMGDLTTLLHETITGNRIVKAFGMEEYERERFSQANERLLKTNMKMLKVNAYSPPLIEFIGSIAIAFMVWYGGLEISRGVMTTGIFCTFLAALYGLYTPIKKLTRVSNSFQQAAAAANRVFSILDTTSEIVERENPLELDAWGKKIEFKKVTFSYDSEKVLDELSLVINPGEITAIVGVSGAGKSTLVNLIPRFYDVTSGSITIGGKDIREYSLRSLRSQIGIVTQENILFNDTVKNNIAYGRKDASLEEIIAAAKAAYAHSFISRLPKGYDTVIGEKGERLSGGERQRIAIARAILKDPPILILDEATSALDSTSEIIVQRALANLMQGRTVVVIAHRLSTVRRADKIVVLDKGKIVEEGTHEELYRANGIYTQLYNLQFHLMEGEIPSFKGEE